MKRLLMHKKEMNNVSFLEISESALIYNLNYFRSKINNETRILAVVKAFSYGSDSLLISKVLQKQNVNYLAVAYVDEGVYLRKNGINLPILVLHPQIDNLPILIKNNLEPNIYNNTILSEFIKLIKNEQKQYAIHLKFNTGLNRLGFQPSSAKQIINKIKKHTNISIASIFSHLVASEDLNEKQFTLNQIQTFSKIKDVVNQELSYQPLFHILNTSGIVNYSNYQFDMVRLGIGLYGFANDPIITSELKNVLSLKSVISQIHTLKKGDTVGYNRAFKVTKNMKSATIPIGHADGISRQLGNGIGYVLINNKKAFIIGNVCMDMIMVNVTDINCCEGDEVILFNSQQMINEMAHNINTIPYELLTMISQRIKRILT